MIISLLVLEGTSMLLDVSFPLTGNFDGKTEMKIRVSMFPNAYNINCFGHTDRQFHQFVWRKELSLVRGRNYQALELGRLVGI